MSQQKIVGVAWYYPEQWDKIRSHSKDRSEMAKDYADWERGAQDGIKKFERDGYTIRKVYIDVDMLVAWCKRQRVPVNGRSRSDYANHLMADRSGFDADI